MLNAYKRFIQLIDDTKNVDAIYQYVNTLTTPLDMSDLLRWQWVQYVSALDKLIHDLVKIGMIEEFTGARIETKQYKNFQLDMDTYSSMISDLINAASLFEQRVVVCNGYKAFQDPKKISEALSYIWSEKDKWKVISDLIGMNQTMCTTKLNNIVIRRNQIVHEGDYTDILSKRQDIYEEDVIEVKEFILQIGKAIYNCVKL